MRCSLFAFSVLLVASPVFSQDPVKVDPKHHKIEVENDHVRVLRITIGPGEKTPTHAHPASVAVFLTDVKHRVSPEGGAVNEEPRKRGDVVMLEGGKHTVENIGSTPGEVVLVELKNPSAPTWKGVARDAAKVDPKHYTVVGENDRARAIKVAYGPKERGEAHDHPPNVTVFLADGQARMTTDGKPTELVVKRGQTIYSDSQSHQPENATAGRIEAIVVELKTAAGAKK